MIITNNEGLPDYLNEWLKHDEYDKHDGISATELLHTPRQFVLNLMEGDKIVMDSTELIPARIGSAIHSSFEHVFVSNVKKEERLEYELEIDGKKVKITGKFDMLLDTDKPVQRLADIKTTSVYTYILKSKDDDYVKQLSVYKYLANKNGYNVSDDAEICMLFTDWSNRALKYHKQQGKEYPERRIVIKRIKLMTDADTEKYIIERLRLFLKAKEMYPDIPRCTDEELWKSPDRYYLKQLWTNKIVRVCNTKSEAEEAAKLYKGCTIVYSPGKVRRCDYCNVRSVCSQYKELQNKEESNEFE